MGNFRSAVPGHSLLHILRGKHFVPGVVNPVRLLKVLPRGGILDQSTVNKPLIEINRHGRFRIILVAVLGEHGAVNVIDDARTRNLSNQGMPAVEADREAILRIFGLPGIILIRVPGGQPEGIVLRAPAAIGQVLKVDFAVIGLHVVIERRDGKERLDNIVAIGPRNRRIVETHTGGIGAFIKFALLKEFGLDGVGRGAIGG